MKPGRDRQHTVLEGEITMMKLLLGVAALTVVATPMLAADMRVRQPLYKTPPPVSSFIWTGCYLGGNVGGGWAEKRVSDVNGTFGLVGGDLGSHTASGGAGGGQIGCDYQAGAWVLGLQGLFDWANLKGDNLQPAGGFFNRTYVSWLTTLTGRVGFTIAPAILLYARGGGAWVRDNHTIVTTGGTLASWADVTRNGWTVGAGIEQSFGGNWSAFAEYNYLTFDTNRVTFTTTVGTFPLDVRQDVHLLTVGLNYHFSPFRY